MKIHIIAVGNRMPKWVQEGWDDYAKRMPADCAVVLHEIKPEPRNVGKTAPQMMLAEAKRIESAIPNNALIIALDERGKDLTTRALSQELDGWRAMGQDVAIIIGGPDGLDAEFKQKAQRMMRLSSLTMPHPMVRILLVEQLYRAWAILVNHPYHRD